MDVDLCAHRVHGLKSGKTLKDFRGHTSYINDCMFTADLASSTQQIVSASSDSTVKVWNAKTTECLHTFSPPQGGETHREISVNSLALLPQNVEHIGEILLPCPGVVLSVVPRPNVLAVVCNRSSSAFVMTLQGTVSCARRQRMGVRVMGLLPSGRKDVILRQTRCGVRVMLHQPQGKGTHVPLSFLRLF